MLKQLKTEAITKATAGSGWLWSLCDNFNTKNKEDIQAGAKFQLELNLYMYAYNEPFVQALTHPNAAARTNIPAELLEAASVPAAPEFVCCFSQLLNPHGLEVDVFVSHFWDHPFARTVQALSCFAETVYKDPGKESPDDVVFWVCLFALNQHQAAEEVGSSPECGSFTAALAKARHGGDDAGCLCSSVQARLVVQYAA